MTRFDVQEYLTKLYNLPVRGVSTEIKMGELEMKPFISKKTDRKRGGPYSQYTDKKPDQKLAYVLFRKDIKFEFPKEILSAGDQDELQNKRVIELEKSYQKQTEDQIKVKPVKQLGVPLWFS